MFHNVEFVSDLIISVKHYLFHEYIIFLDHWICFSIIFLALLIRLFFRLYMFGTLDLFQDLIICVEHWICFRI